MLETFAALYAQWQCKFIGVEDVAFQRMAIQQLRERGLLVKAYKPEGDKVSRTLQAQLKNEAGELWLPEIPEMEDELCSFPNGRFDDVVDALSMGVILGCKYARWKPSPPPLTEEEQKAKADEWEKKEFARLMMQGT
jgi:phage terminase large subunit-like protein